MRGNGSCRSLFLQSFAPSLTRFRFYGMLSKTNAKGALLYECGHDYVS